MDDTQKEQIRAYLYTILDGSENIDTLSFSTIRQEISKALNIPNDILRSHKDDITQFIIDYKENGKRADKSSSNSNIVKKSGKFSDKENKIITKCTSEYMESRNLEVNDICTFFKDEKENRKHLHEDLWAQICDLLPQRTKQVQHKQNN
jgi:hypothetical protein